MTEEVLAVIRHVLKALETEQYGEAWTALRSLERRLTFDEGDYWPNRELGYRLAFDEEDRRGR